MAARQHYSVSNAGPVNNTSNATWADIVQLPDFEPDASSTYAFFWSSALQNATNATADAQLRVRFGPAGFETTIATLNLESAATTEYPQLAGMFFHVEGVTPIDVYADVAIKAETNTNSINAKNGQIVALKLGANDVAAESLTRQTTTSTTPADAVSASFTSDGGDYVVVGYGEFDINIGTVPAYMRLRCEGTNTAELGVRTNDATNLSPGMMVWRFTSVAAGSRTAAFQFRAHTSSTAGITNARILVMRAADFDAVYGAQLTSDSASTSSDAVAITFTETLTANPHLLLGGWGTSSTTTSTLITSQVTEAGSDIAESVRRTYNAAQIRFHASGFASLRAPGSGSKTYTLDRVQSGSANIAVGAGSALALIDLGSSGGSNHTLTATTLATGSPTLGAPAVTQKHTIVATALSTAAPTLGNPAATQKHGLTASNLNAGTPALGSPALTPVHVLAATGLSTGAPTLGAPTVTQAHLLSGTALATGAPTLGSPAATQAHGLAASALAAGTPALGAPAIVQAQSLTATGFVAGAPALGQPTLTGTHIVAANDLDAPAPTLGTPVLAIAGAMIPDSLNAGTPTLGSPVIAQGHGLAATGIAAGTPQIGQPTLGQANWLVADALAAGSASLGAAVFTQRHMLVGAGIDAGTPTLDAAEFVQAYSLAANDTDVGLPDLGTPGLNYVAPEVPANRHATTRPGLTAATTTTTNRSAASDPDLRTATTSKGRRAA